MHQNTLGQKLQQKRTIKCQSAYMTQQTSVMYMINKYKPNNNGHTVNLAYCEVLGKKITIIYT